MGAKVVNKNGYFNFGGVQKLYTKGAKVVNNGCKSCIQNQFLKICKSMINKGELEKDEQN